MYLVGAGPGDAGLLTLRGREVIEAADVVLCDNLVGPEIRAMVRGELIDVGKVGGGPQVPQEETERLLVEHAKAGRTVVRLKGGDPFVFGRGGEEAQACAREGIPFAVVRENVSGVVAIASRLPAFSALKRCTGSSTTV